MASQSPQRTRKALQQPQLQQHTGPAAANVRREASPEPSLRERQRYARTQSMPIVSVHDPADPQSQSQSSQTQQQPQIGYPRPIPLARVAPPQFLHGHSQTEKWQMTDDLQAEIERADLLQQTQQRQQAHSPAPAPGTAGVAYAGGAVSAVGFVGHMKTHSTGSVSVGTETMEVAPTARRRMSAEQAQHRASPLSYALRKTANTSPGYPSMPSPRSTKNRTPDRSLPVQEEPDDHEHDHDQARRVSPAPSSDLNHTKDLDHDAEGTLVDLGDDDDDEQSAAQTTEGEGSHTPRSPSNVLFPQGHPHPPRSIHDVLQPDKSAKSFNHADFQHTLKKLQAEGGVGVGVGANGMSSSLPPHPPPHPPFSRNEYSRNESRGSYPNWMFDFYHNYPEEIEYYDEAAYMQQFLPAPIATQGMHLRPDAPIPPTPHSQTSAPTPFPNQQNGNGTSNQNQNAESAQRLVPPFSPAPPSGTPYPYPFSHVRRGFVYPPPVPRVASTIYDPSVVQEQLRLQMQMYAYNNGAMSDSTLSPASTPFPGVSPAYTPFGAFLNQSRAFARARAESNVGMNGGEDGRVTSASIRSSPSHLPVPLPPLYPGPRGRERGLKKRDRFSNMRGSSGKVNGALRARPRTRVQVPPRVDSTQPRETSPEPSSGEETAGEKFGANGNGGGDEERREEGEHVGADGDAREWTNGVRHEEEDEIEEWVDEDSEDEHELLDLEFHPTFITNPERRRKRWEQRWDELVRAFQALDRETDATLVLMASPSHTTTLHALSSRSIRRDPSLFDGHPMNAARDSFEQLAAQRRATRSQHTSLLERLYASQSASTAASQNGDGSPASASGVGAGEREEDLRKMLKTALGSLSAVHQMYEVRETRWREEERRMREERASMDLLIHQALGGAIAAHHPIP